MGTQLSLKAFFRAQDSTAARNEVGLAVTAAQPVRTGTSQQENVPVSTSVPGAARVEVADEGATANEEHCCVRFQPSTQVLGLSDISKGNGFVSEGITPITPGPAGSRQAREPVSSGIEPSQCTAGKHANCGSWRELGTGGAAETVESISRRDTESCSAHGDTTAHTGIQEQGSSPTLVLCAPEAAVTKVLTSLEATVTKKNQSIQSSLPPRKLWSPRHMMVTAGMEPLDIARSCEASQTMHDCSHNSFSQLLGGRTGTGCQSNGEYVASTASCSVDNSSLVKRKDGPSFPAFFHKVRRGQENRIPSLSCNSGAKPLIQMHLDLGQADFSVSRCPVCGLVYAKGEQRDEKVHLDYHRKAVKGFTCKALKSGRVIFTDAMGCILMVLPGDPPNHLQKVKELCNHVELELGISPGWLQHADTKAFLYVSKKHAVLGLVLMEQIQRARRVAYMAQDSRQGDDGADCVPGRTSLSQGCDASTPALGRAHTNASGGVSVPAVCGIRAIWVASSFRRQGTASKLVDAARSKCMMGYVVPRSEVAFSHPTELGQLFAAHYTGSHEFLTY